MASINSVKEIKGVSTNSNPLSNPDNLSIGDNCVLTRSGLIGPRGGFQYYVGGNGSTIISATPTQMMEFQGTKIWVDKANNLYGSSALQTVSQYSGTYLQSTGGNPNGPTYSMRGKEIRGNFYFTSAAGMMKLTTPTSQPTQAGTPGALDQVLTAVSAVGGFITKPCQYGYRHTWIKTDANKMVVEGPPSTREVVGVNAGTASISSGTITTGVLTCTATATLPWSVGTVLQNGIVSGLSASTGGAIPSGPYAVTILSGTTFSITVGSSYSSTVTATAATLTVAYNVQLQISVPDGVVPGDQLAIYRTVGSASLLTDPGDNEVLVFKTIYAQSAVFITYTDTTLDTSLTTTPLYTNETASGFASANYAPPLCADFELYRDYAFYANCRSLDQIINFQFVTATGGFVAGTSKLILTSTNGFTETYLFSVTENSTNFQPALIQSGSPATNIAATAKSLIRTINQSSNYWYAAYQSGLTDPPGIITITDRNYSVGQFWITADSTATGNNFSPAVPISGKAIISDASLGQNRVYFSSYQAPESVPLENYYEFGARDMPVYRIIALTNSLMVIKADGIYYLSGYGGTSGFTNSLLNGSAKCISGNSCSTINNKIYALTEQGILEISESGVNLVSFDIDPDIKNLSGQSNLNLVFGQGFERERIYMLFYPGPNDTYCTASWNYNIIQQGWTRWTKSATCSLVSSSDYNLYLSSGQETAVLNMRNTQTAMDQSDEEINVQITAYDSVNGIATINYSYMTPFDIGFSLHQNGLNGKVIDYYITTTQNQYVCTLDQAQAFTAGAATVRIPVYSHARFNPQTCGEAGIAKSFQDVQIMILPGNNVTTADIEMISNENGSIQKFPQTRQIASGWGNDQWGSVWDGSSNNLNVPFRENVPYQLISGETLTVGWLHNMSMEDWDIGYMAITYNSVSTIVSATAQGVVLE